MRKLLSGMGFYETMTFSFIAHKKLEQLGLSEDDDRMNALALRNPLGEDSAFMRTTLLCGVMTTAQLNQAHGNDHARIYELGKVFDNVHRTAENLPTEHDSLCLCCYGGDEDFYSLRGVVEVLLSQTGVATPSRPTAEPWLHPGRRGGDRLRR